MNIKPLLVILLPVLLFVAAGLVGSTRRLGFWWTVLLSVLLTPLGGFVFAVLSGPRRPGQAESEHATAASPYGLSRPE